MWFDIERAVSEAQLPEETVESILVKTRIEFPNDEMMYELHVIRALQAEQRQRMGPDAWRQRRVARRSHPSSQY